MMTGNEIRNYRYEDLNIGFSESFVTEITADKVKKFLEISGDINPLHIDKEFAISMGFHSEVVYGMLTASYLSKLGGVFLPGKRCIIQEVSIKFTRPVYIGDTLTVTGTIKELIM